MYKYSEAQGAQTRGKPFDHALLLAWASFLNCKVLEFVR